MFRYNILRYILEKQQKAARDKWGCRSEAIKLIMLYSNDPDPNRDMIPVNHIPRELLKLLDATVAAIKDCYKVGLTHLVSNTYLYIFITVFYAEIKQNHARIRF